MKEFRAFVLRGNAVDLAVGVVIGSAFGAVVTSLVENVLTPLVGIFGTPDFSRLAFAVGRATVRYGLVLNALITFLMIAATIFFFVIKPVNRLMAAMGIQGEVGVAKKPCPHCLSDIPAKAARCAFCTYEISPA